MQSENSPPRSSSTIGRPIVAGAIVLSLLAIGLGYGLAHYGRTQIGAAVTDEAGSHSTDRDNAEAHAEAAAGAERLAEVFRRASHAADVIAERARGPGAWWSETAAPEGYGAPLPLGATNAHVVRGDHGGFGLETGSLPSSASAEQIRRRIAGLHGALHRIEPVATSVIDEQGGILHAAVWVIGKGVFGAPRFDPPGVDEDVGTDDLTGREILNWYAGRLWEDPPVFGTWRGPSSGGPLGGQVLTYVLPVPVDATLPEAVVAVDMSHRTVRSALGSSSVLVHPDGWVLATGTRAAKALRVTDEAPSRETLSKAFVPFLGGADFLTVPEQGATFEIDDRVAAAYPVTGTPWSVVAIRDLSIGTSAAHNATSRIEAAADRMGWMVLAVLGLTAVLFTLGAMVLAHYLRRRLRPLVEGAAAHAGGDLTHRVIADGSDEFGEIAASLNSTALRLRHTIGWIEEGERRLQGLIDNMAEGFVICDEDDRVGFANKRLAELLARSPEDLFGQYFEDLLLPTAVSQYRRELSRRRVGRTTRYETTCFRSGGQHPRVLIAGMPLYDQDGRYSGSYAVLTDITGREEAQRHTAQEEKLRALGEMAGALAHDLNNNLTAILGNAQYLLLDEHDEPVVHALGVIEKAALSANETVRRMREFTKPRSLELGAELANPNALLTAALDAVRVRFAPLARESGVEYRISLDAASKRPIRCHPEELQEALANVISNALESMPAGGSLELAAFDRGEDAIAYRVVDQGCGIDAETARKIFDPFFTTKVDPSEYGSGLGLSIAYGIVRAHHGRIDLRSEPQEGTTLTIVVPAFVSADGRESRADDDAAPIGPPEPSAALVLPANKRATALAGRLTELGISTQLVHDIESALGVLADPQRHNAAVIEYELDAANGWEFARKVRVLRPDIFLLLVANAEHRLDVTQAKNAGIDRVLTRPFDAHDVQSALLQGVVARHAQAGPSDDDARLSTLTGELQEITSRVVTEVWSAGGVDRAGGTEDKAVRTPDSIQDRAGAESAPETVAIAAVESGPAQSAQTPAMDAEVTVALAVAEAPVAAKPRPAPEPQPPTEPIAPPPTTPEPDPFKGDRTLADIYVELPVGVDDEDQL